MINGENVFDQPVKNNKITCENIRKIATGQGDDYTTGCLLYYLYFKDSYKITYENIRKIVSGQGGDYTMGCLLDYPYFKDSYKMIAVDLSKQQALDANPRATQQINFTGNLNRAGNIRIYFILEQAKEPILYFS